MKHYDWNKNFTFSNTEIETKESNVRYSSEMLTTKEAMEYLGIGRCRIRTLIEEGNLNPVVIRDRKKERKFSYHFNLEELSILKLEMIFSKNKKIAK